MQINAVTYDLFLYPRRFSLFYGGRGGSKSWGVADYLILVGTQKKLRVLCTREVQNSIADSVHTLLRDRIEAWGLGAYYRITNNAIINESNGTAFAFHGLKNETKDSLKSFEGADLCWVEEAQSITQPALDILEPTIRREGSRIIYTMNRDLESDPVFKAHGRAAPDTLVRKINYYDNPYCPAELIAEARKCKRDRPDDYEHIWEGEPQKESGNFALSGVAVRAAMGRRVEPEGPLCIGIDVALTGADDSVITARRGYHTYAQLVLHGAKYKETAARARDYERELALNAAGAHYNIDAGGGYGEGVAEFLREAGAQDITMINNGAPARESGKYADCVTEQFFTLPIDALDLPDDPQLFDDLTARRYCFDKQYRRKVESKLDLKARLGRSPDRGDSLLLAYYAPSEPVIDDTAAAFFRGD
jgi:phage terminase large subunit